MQTSAAMLGLALSFGASAPLLTEPELALAADGPHLTVLPATNREQGQMALLGSTQAVPSSAYHTVEPGESLWKIAAQHEADVQVIKAVNGIVADDTLRVGQVIRVPAVGMDNLPPASSASRLALKSEVTGGVGGDLAAGSGLRPTSAIPSVDNFEKVWDLGETLSLDEDSEIPKENLVGSGLDQTLSGDAVEEDRLELASSRVSDEASLSEANSLEGDKGWSSADVQGAPPEGQPLAAVNEADSTPSVTSIQPVPEPAQAEIMQASLPLHDEGEVSVASPASPAPIAARDQVADSKKDIAMAALPLRSAEAVVSADSSTLRAYQVKPGDTLWSIASRHGVTLDELLSHNAAVESPETLVAGDNISIPVASAPAESAQTDAVVSSAASSLAAAPATREQVIRDHLARIRESNSASINRDELNARIREARQELERSRNGSADQTAVSLEYYAPQSEALTATASGGAEPASATALAAREGTQTADVQWTVTDAAQNRPQAIAAVESAVIPGVNASEPSIQPSLVQPEAANIPSQLLAAAPLGADAYRVAPNLPVGQTVTPSMPMMPGADQFLPEAPSNGMIWPTQGTFTSGYGWRWGRMHRGIDIAGPVGTPIVAAATGVVVRSGWNSGGYGNLVDIRHADGSITRYAHNSRLLVREGQQVQQGQQISEMGSTGYSTGPHLHFEIHPPNSGAVNPMAYLPAR